MNKHSILIHGGSGTILRKFMTPEKEERYKSGLQKSLVAGNTVLERGGTALDAVEAAVIVLEDNPIFNAGRGAVFTHEGTNEMDASIMCGKTSLAGAVTGISNVKNPILLARAVMEKSDYVLLSGDGAKRFAKVMNIPFETDEYFYTQERYDQLLKVRDSHKMQLDHADDKKFGTVGAVALDVYGNLAAATSTGGMTNKRYGRVGDTPLIGAGTYANNRTCAVSCTGQGEYFMRSVVAYDISCLIEYKGLTLKEACDTVVNKKLKSIGAKGGLISIDATGNTELVFNTEGMYRGTKSEGEDYNVAIFD